MTYKQLFSFSTLVITSAFVQTTTATVNTDAMEQLLVSSMENSLAMTEITKGLDDKKYTTQEASEKIAAITQELVNNALKLESDFTQISREDYQALATELKGPAIGKLISRMEEMLKEQKAKLKEEAYYNDKELEKACHTFFSACELYI